MLVFIDESGDPGFKLDSGSSPVFVAAMVIFADRNAARATEQAIRDANRMSEGMAANAFARSDASGFHHQR